MDTKLVGLGIGHHQPVKNIDRTPGSLSAHRGREDVKNPHEGAESVSMKEQAKLAQNKRIMESALDVNLSAGNRSMEVLYRAAIENINARLEPVMGKEAIQNAYDSGLDVSPEATADRIVSMSTAFFSAYQKQHPEMPLDEALESFVSIIGGGIDQGFGEAREILDGLKVLEGEIAENMDKTYDLVQTGLQAFIDNFAK